MNKPLTIDELKALKVGDWVWICDITKRPRDESQYVRFTNIRRGMFCFDGVDELNGWSLDAYGIDWLAYKNKERAEAKGEIVELPCIRKVVADNMEKYHVYHIGRCGLYKNVIVYDWCDTSDEAERRLAELKGRNE